MPSQSLSLEVIRKIESLFPTVDELLAAADYCLEQIETAKNDPVYWRKEELSRVIQVLEATVKMRSGSSAGFKWIDPEEELRPAKPLNRIEQALFQAKTIALKTSDMPYP